jgi:hypothetical protein
MTAFTRVNGLACTAGTLYGLNVKLFKVVVKNTSAAAQNIQAEDDAVNEVVEQIVKEVSPLAFFVADANGGVMHLVTDVSLSATDLQHRIRQIGAATPAVRTGSTTFTYAVTSVGPNTIDISGTTVTDPTSFTTA